MGEVLEGGLKAVELGDGSVEVLNAVFEVKCLVEEVLELRGCIEECWRGLGKGGGGVIEYGECGGEEVCEVLEAGGDGGPLFSGGSLLVFYGFEGCFGIFSE
mgnify:CR=1 FL=1